MKNRKKLMLIAGFYLISFIVTFMLANHILNYDRIHPSKYQGDTSLIKLYVKSSGIRFNEMIGYAEEMDAAYLRTSLTPVSDSKNVTIQLEEPASGARQIYYALMDESNAKEIESGECPDIERVEGERQTQINFSSELQQGKEYCLNLTVLDDSGETYYYYTRVVYGTNFQMYDKIQFIMDFHNATFQKSATASIAEHLAYSSDASSNDFRTVSIYTDSDTVTWGDLDPEVVSDVDITILNLNSETAEIQLFYEIQARDDLGNDYNYSVTEFYDVASTGSTVSLIGYSRKMDEKLDDQSFYFNNSNLRLGIVDKDKTDVQVYGKEEPEEEENTSETGQPKQEEEYNTYISFVADGGLWVYNTRDNVLTKAFGFERKSQVSHRDQSYLNHGIKVLRTEENGDLYFAVYGYMYNGDGEGRFGIEVNKYNRADGTYSEILFIPYDKNFALLEQSIEKMAFVDEENRMYLYLEGNIYCFDLMMKKFELVLEGADSQDCAISDDGQSIVRSIRDTGGKIQCLEWKNLNTGETKEILNGSRQLHMIGFLGDNLVYGILKEGQDVMESVQIVDDDQNLLREYRVPDGGYITEAYITDDLLTIYSRTKDHQDRPEDYILYNESEIQEAEIFDVYQELRMRETWISTDTYGNDMPVVLFARGVETYSDTQMAFKAEGNIYDGFYVNINGKLEPCPDFAQAYKKAFDNDGKIVDSQGRIIVRPASRVSEKSLNGPGIGAVETDETAQQREVLQWLLTFEKKEGEPSLDGGGMLQNLQANFPDYHVVDLTGIGLDDALSMISEGSPLIVKNSEGTWCVAEGYSDNHIEIADSKDGTVVKYERDSAVNGIASSGNIIYSYYK